MSLFTRQNPPKGRQVGRVGRTLETSDGPCDAYREIPTTGPIDFPQPVND